MPRNRDSGIFLQKRRGKWTACDTREHREPAIRNGQWAFVYEKHQAANAREERPRPSQDLKDHQTNYGRVFDHSMKSNEQVERGGVVPRSIEAAITYPLLWLSSSGPAIRAASKCRPDRNTGLTSARAAVIVNTSSAPPPIFHG
jgi:hypothetical protein